MNFVKQLPNGLKVPEETTILLQSSNKEYSYYTIIEGRFYFWGRDKWCKSATHSLEHLVNNYDRIVWMEDALLKTYMTHPKYVGLPVLQTALAGVKHDSGKPRYSLLPKGVLTPVIRVLEFGCVKYGENNWQSVPNARERYYNASIRHLTAWFEGESLDPETNEPHLAHAMCCLMFLMWGDNK